MVKCADCGFLSLYSEDGEQIVYADAIFRMSGERMRERRVRTFPICFKRAINLPVLIQNEPEGQRPHVLLDQATHQLRDIVIANPTAVLAVIQAERQCDQWAEWHQGFSPKEHQEMIDRQWMLREQRRATRFNLLIGAFAVLTAALAVFFGAKFSLESAHLQADATLEAARLQIDAQRSAPPVAINLVLPTSLPVPDLSGTPTP